MLQFDWERGTREMGLVKARETEIERMRTVVMIRWGG